MSLPRLLFVAPFLILLGCSDNPESTIDEMAERSKELVEEARNTAQEASEQVDEKLGKAKDAAREQLTEAVDQLSGQ